MFLRVPVRQDLDQFEKLLIGRLFVLSQYGTQKVIYSDSDCLRDGFTTAKFYYSLHHFKKIGIIKMADTRPRTIEVNLQKDSSDLFLNVPIDYLKERNIKLSGAEKILLGRLCLLQLSKGEDFVYHDTKAAEELGLSLRTIKRAFAKLKDLGLITTLCKYDKELCTKFRTIKVNIIIADQSAILTPCSDNSTSINDTMNLHECHHVTSIDDTMQPPQMALSSLSNEHINERINEHVNEQCAKSTKNTSISYPKNVDEVKPYFDKYIQNYKHKDPLLEEVDLTKIMIGFFEYYAQKDWHDKKGQKVKNIYARICTWMQKVSTKHLPRVKKQLTYEKAMEEMGKDYPRMYGNKQKTEPIDVQVEVVNDNSNDDLPFSYGS